MSDALKDLAADILEAPEAVADLTSKAFGAVAEALAGMAARLDVIEAMLRADDK